MAAPQWCGGGGGGCGGPRGHSSAVDHGAWHPIGVGATGGGGGEEEEEEEGASDVCSHGFSLEGMSCVLASSLLCLLCSLHVAAHG